MTSEKKVLVLPGDGIGQEVCEQVVPLLQSLSLPLQFEFGEIGWSCWQSEGNAVPDRTWTQIRQADAVLLGAITSKPKVEAEADLPSHLQGRNIRYVSPVIQLRQKLDLFANVRPAWFFANHHYPFSFEVIRENTEGLYAGFDYHPIPEELTHLVRHTNIARSESNEASISIRLQTHYGLERLFRFAFERARKRGYSLVTFADKPNVLRESGAFARDIFHQVAAGYQEIECEIQNVDAVAMWMVTKPERFGVVVAENMFGDILSDVAGGVMGGLGLAASANIGDSCAYFEPVHGSAPHMLGHACANPSAMILSASLMLEHLGFDDEALSLQKAVRNTVRKAPDVTYDLGGRENTSKMAETIKQVKAAPKVLQTASIVTVGEELLKGRFHNENLKNFSELISMAGYVVKSHLVLGDSFHNIANELRNLIGVRDLLVVSGGLGPTTDDLTREAVASAARRPLVKDKKLLNHIEAFLADLNLSTKACDSVQALIPEGSEVLHNPNGTACGFRLQFDTTEILVLPGPPKEAQPMLKAAMKERAKPEATAGPRWMLFDQLETTVAPVVDEIAGRFGVKPHYVWRFPYLELSLTNDLTGYLPSKLIGEIDARFGDLSVSRTGIRASQAVEIDKNIHVKCHDDQLSVALDAMGFNVETDASDAACLTVETSPQFSQINGNPTTDSFVFRCTKANSAPFEFSVKLRGQDIIQQIQELLCWSLLKHLSETKEVA